MTAVLLSGDVLVDPASLERLMHRVPDISSLRSVGEDADLGDTAAAQQVPTVVITSAKRSAESITGIARRLADGAGSGVLVVAAPDDTREAVGRALLHGARGCVLDGSPAEELVTAIRAVAAGHLFVPAVLLGELADTVLVLALRADTLERGRELTHRELEVLRLLALGTPNAELATELFISEATVRSHVLSILRKLGVRNRTEAVAMVYRNGLFRPKPSTAT